MNKKETIYNKIYTILSSLKFYGSMIIMFTAVGIGPGYPGIRNYLIESGVFSDLCKNLNTTIDCKKQETKLDNVANMSLTLLNATTLIAGILVDFLGNKLTGIIGIILWIISMSISGFNPNIGIFWQIGFIIYNVSSIMIFFPIIFLYIPTIFKDNKVVIPCALAIITGIWDLSGMSLTLLSDILDFFTIKPSITYVFMTYGIIIGGYSLIYVLYNFGCKENDNSNEELICQNIKNQFKSSYYYISNLIYWVAS